ncbi:hypothetical protein AB0K60_09355 [Thermopolyspora sp. NPDC052614]|uniref:hypothetical protein n=1 Tax=Thermopolyspora sp. NPDC052614 TaxID=3155682 RepID=UPI00342F9353
MAQIEIPERLKRAELVLPALEGRVEGLPPSAALAMLPHLDITLERHHSILREALGNAGLAPPVRALSVLALRRLPGELAVGELEDVLSRQGLEETVAIRAASLLGLLGGDRHLDLLLSVRAASDSEPVIAAATFARSLIVHRLRLSGVPAEDPEVRLQDVPDDADGTAFHSRRLGLPRRDDVIESVRRDFPDIGPHDHEVYELPCAGQIMSIVVHKDVLEPRRTGLLREVPLLAAVVAVTLPGRREIIPSHAALTRPDASAGISLRVTRLTGLPAYAGHGRLTPDGVVFELLSVAAIGVAPVRATCTISSSGELRVFGASFASCPASMEPSASGDYPVP